MMNISVVIPTYNRIELLKRSIDSVINQTIKPSEIIIVDDGSNDGTEAMVKKKYDSLKLIKQKNKGASAARNSGIKASSGEWICFLDSDDEWKNDKLEKQIIAVANNSDYKFFHSSSESKKQIHSPDDALIPEFLAALTPLFFCLIIFKESYCFLTIASVPSLEPSSTMIISEGFIV